MTIWALRERERKVKGETEKRERGEKDTVINTQTTLKIIIIAAVIESGHSQGVISAPRASTGFRALSRAPVR